MYYVPFPVTLRNVNRKNKPVISFAKFVVSITSIISSKMEITFEVTTLGRSLFLGGRCFWHSLTPAKVLRYFRSVPSFAKGGGVRYYRYLTVQELHSI